MLKQKLRQVMKVAWSSGHVYEQYHKRSQTKRLLIGGRIRIKFRSSCQLEKWMWGVLLILICKDFSKPELHLNKKWSILTIVRKQSITISSLLSALK